MDRKNNFRRLTIHLGAPMIAISTLSTATFFGSRSALAQTGAAPASVESQRAPPDTARASPPISFFASERNAATPIAPEARPSSPGSTGSLILMEIRTQRGTAKSSLPLIPNLDPRLKPLGW
ncbi:MAG TPA: hypothetical protein VGY55_19030 [Pirellulales bacterium]|nr:hypothetical protein [Pirellulales bacterium]